RGLSAGARCSTCALGMDPVEPVSGTAPAAHATPASREAARIVDIGSFFPVKLPDRALYTGAVDGRTTSRPLRAGIRTPQSTSQLQPVQGKRCGLEALSRHGRGRNVREPGRAQSSGAASSIA